MPSGESPDRTGGSLCYQKQFFNREKADGTAKYANHAKAEQIRGGSRFSQRV